MRPLHRLLCRAAYLDLETEGFKIAPAAVARRRLDVEQPQTVDAEQRLEGERLELALGAIADECHGARALRRQIARGKGGGGGGAQCRQNGHFA